jgi:sugar lactone lactonase YvrE
MQKIMANKLRATVSAGIRGLRLTLRLGALIGFAWATVHTLQWLAPRARVLDTENWRLQRVAVLRTGTASAEQSSISPNGRWLAVASPDDQMLVVYEIDDLTEPRQRSRVRLPGRPNALAFTSDGRTILLAMSPAADGPALGWIEARDVDGRRSGEAVTTGVRTDDVAVDAGGRFALAICGGKYKAPGKNGDPRQPRLLVIDLRAGVEHMTVRAELEFMLKNQSPESVAISPDGRWAAVSMQRRSEVALIDLQDCAQPRIVRNFLLQPDDHPDGLAFDPSNRRLLTANEHSGSLSLVDLQGRRRGAVRCDLPKAHGRAAKAEEVAAIECHGRQLAVVTLARSSAIAVVDITAGDAPRWVGNLPVHISWRPFSRSKPEGLAVCPSRGLFAVSDEDAAEVVLFRYAPAAPIAFHGKCHQITSGPAWAMRAFQDSAPRSGRPVARTPAADTCAPDCRCCRPRGCGPDRPECGSAG